MLSYCRNIKIFDYENEKKMHKIMVFGGENVLTQVVKVTENRSITHAHKNHH